MRLDKILTFCPRSARHNDRETVCPGLAWSRKTHSTRIVVLAPYQAKPAKCVLVFHGLQYESPLTHLSTLRYSVSSGGGESRDAGAGGTKACFVGVRINYSIISIN